MPHRYPLLIVLTLLVLLCCVTAIWSQSTPAFNAPFTATLTDARTVTIQPLPIITLPDGLEPGDRVNLPEMDFDTRFLLLPLLNDDAMYPGAERSYQLPVHRGNTRLTVSVTSVNLGVLPAARFFNRWSIAEYEFNALVFAALALLVLWRGRERAAAGLALWVIADGVGIAVANIHFDGVTGVSLIVASEILFLLARIGLYLMVDFLVGATLSTRTLWLWRGSFIAILAVGLVSQIAGSLLFLTVGWAGFLFPAWQSIWVVSYLIPVAMLFISYRSVSVTERLRLRWMLWSGALWVLAIGIFDLRPFGYLGSNLLGSLGQVLAAVGFLYAVLRHRAVDVSVAIDRTLVYGSVTALVVGILAALNSVLQHAALGTSASLLLQIVVPLALGIVLGQVRNYADKIVERVFFRQRFLAEKSIRRFARYCNQFEQADEMLRQMSLEIQRHLKVPGIAIYERDDTGYAISQQSAGLCFPEHASVDDPAFVAARGRQKKIDLSELHSMLGTDGYVFPMTAPGGMRGVLVCANRPGEHYASDERKLLAYVARQVGMALYALRVKGTLLQLKAKAGLVDALANGSVSASPEVQTLARELSLAASS